MSKLSRSKTGFAARPHRTTRPNGIRVRRLTFESLEVRQLLTSAPTGIVFQPTSDQGSATLTPANNSAANAAKELKFLVSGVTAGDTVYVYADNSTAIASGTVATGATSITLTSTGTHTLTDGQHTFVAVQADTSGTLSSATSSITITVFAGLGLTKTTATATVGTAFSFTAAANVPSGDTATITAGSSLLSGMSFSNNTFSGWTPASTDAGTTKTFTVDVKDTLNNSTTTVTVYVAVAPTSAISVVSAPAQVAVGSPVLVSFNESGSASKTYTVTTTSTSDPTGSHLTATVLPQTNQVLQVVTDQGEMDFELFNNYTPSTVAHFVSLVNSGTYGANATFYRIINNFMNQGGIGGSSSIATIPVELNKDLRFTSDGLLAMANNGVDGNSSEFFITNPNDMSDGFLDFRYTIFGKLISGDYVRQAIAAAQVGASGSETSAPLEPPKITSMSIATLTTGGVLMLKASSGAQGPYTVTISDGTNSQTFKIEAGTNSSTSTAIANSFDPPNPWVNAINGNDRIYTAYNTAATFTPSTASANGTSVQVSVQALSGLTQSGAVAPGYKFDNSFSGALSLTSPCISVTQNGSSYTVTPATGFYGIEMLEVMGFTPISSSFALQVGTKTTISMIFDSTNPAGTATAIQSALRNIGFSAATVSVGSTSAPDFTFNVNFGSSVTNIAAASAPSGFSISNSVSAAAATQVLTFAIAGASWDATSGVSPVYRAFVPVYVAPPAPKIGSISAGGKTISTNTFYNNSSASTELTFTITGVVGSATVSVYMDGSTTPLATGTAGYTTSGTLKLTTDGSTKIADGAHTFTVKQTVPTGDVYNYANLTSSGTGAQFNITGTTLNSPASAGTPLTIGFAVIVTPLTKASVGARYTYVVQTNAPSSDAVTVTPVTMPSGMSFDGHATFTWTPTSSQLNTSPSFQATIADSQGRTGTIGPVNITVGLGVAPTQVLYNATSGGSVTVSFSGATVVVYDNIGRSVLSSQTFKSTDTVEIDVPAGQTNNVTVNLPAKGAAIPYQVSVVGAASSTSNQVTVNGTSAADTFTVAGNTVTANGLQVTGSTVQSLTLAGGGGNDDYVLTSSAIPLTIVNTGSQGTLDFSHDAAGVAVNLGLSRGQSQFLAGWNTTLALNGVLSELFGSAYADTLTGGAAAMTIIHSGTGNDTLAGGSGDNILVGGGGSDTLRGGPNKNLMIGGSGVSTIYAAGSSNIAFGGTTNYDANDQALINLLNQGTRAMSSYAARRLMASAKQNPALLSSMVTYKDNGAHNTIFGNKGDNLFAAGKYGVVK